MLVATSSSLAAFHKVDSKAIGFIIAGTKTTGSLAVPSSITQGRHMRYPYSDMRRSYQLTGYVLA